MTALFLMGATLAACGDGSEGLAPELRTPATGVYQYDAIVQVDDSLADTLAGVLDISFAHPDSIVGRWNVPGFVPATERGLWNVNAYVIPATPTQHGGTLNHRIWRRSDGSGLLCTSSYQRVEPTDTFSANGSCSLVR